MILLQQRDTFIAEQLQTVWTASSVNGRGEVFNIVTNYMSVNSLGRMAYEMKVNGRGFVALQRIGRNHFATLSGLPEYLQITTNRNHEVFFSDRRGTLFPKSYLEKVEEIVPSTSSIVELTSAINDTCLTLKLQSVAVVPVANNTSSETVDYKLIADIDVRSSTEDEVKLKDISFFITHDTTFFGQFLADNPNITILYPEDYDDYSKAYYSDESDKLSFELNYNVGAGSPKDVKETFSSLLTIEFLFESSKFDELLSIDMPNPDSVKSTIEFIDGTEETVECHLTEGSIKDSVENLMTPVIHSLESSEVPAGTRELHSKLTINGNGVPGQGFGSTQGSSKVVFTVESGVESTSVALRIGSPYAGDYISWSDQKIEVFVPSEVINSDGSITNLTSVSGPIYVEVDGGQSNEVELEIPYSIYNTNGIDSDGKSYGKPVFLTNQNSLGSYDVYYTNSFKDAITNDGEPYTNLFEEAMSEWCAQTGYSFRIVSNDFTSSPMSCNSRINVGKSEFVLQMRGIPRKSNLSVKFDDIDNDCDLAECFEFYVKTDALNTASFVRATLKKFMSHEIGHLNMLKHVNNPSDLMGPGAGGGIIPNTLTGAEVVISTSSEKSYLSGQCTTSSSMEISDERKVKFFSHGNMLTLESSDEVFQSVSLYDEIGRLISRHEGNLTRAMTVSLSKEFNLILVSAKMKSGAVYSSMVAN